ncbi:MAG: acyl carrier protein [Streptomyces sp.]|jgi:acyl carrier protein|nr:acyl carrier protein [Streptomyces sp.]
MTVDPADAIITLLTDLGVATDRAFGSETRFRDIPGWDSMNALRLLAAAEDRFGIRFDLRHYLRAETVAELGALVAANRGHR